LLIDLITFINKKYNAVAELDSAVFSLGWQSRMVAVIVIAVNHQ
jgi:hypothetical protein